MLRLPLRARKSGLVSGIAMAMALAGGAVVATAVTPTEAHAQEYSKQFKEVYGKTAEHVTAETPDWNAAKAMLPALAAAAKNADEIFAAGQMHLQVGNAISDTGLQRQGLKMSLESGKVPPEKLGTFNWYAGQLAFQAEDWAVARDYMTAAGAAGYAEGDPNPIILQTYMRADDIPGALGFIRTYSASQVEAGGMPNENMLQLGLKAAYESDMSQDVIDFGTMLVTHYPTEQNWIYATQTIAAVGQFEPQAQLDLLRLQREAASLQQPLEYYEYAEAAGYQTMGAEVVSVIDEGVAAGHISTGDTIYTEAYPEAKRRAAMDRKEAPGLVAEARAASTGQLAQGTGDAFFSYGAYAEAEDMYSTALEKGVKDRQMVTTRVGIAQARQGKLAEARETFASVGGPREPIAKLWIAYIDSQM